MTLFTFDVDVNGLGIGESRPGQVPIRFELVFEADEIDQRMSYALRAKILDGERLLFINDRHYPVLTRGAGRHVDMMLVQAKRPDPGLSGAANAGHETAASDEGTQRRGMFRYLADAALFRDCRDGKSYPVAMEGGYLELERAYLDSGIEGGTEVLVWLEGRYLERPPMEGNISEINLIVDKLHHLDPTKTCTPDVSATLTGTYWKLLELGGTAVSVPEGGREPHLILAGNDSRLRGHGGCNSFFGQFDHDGDSLRFSAIGSTMMACPEGMEAEDAFLQALQGVNRFGISGLFLTLYRDDQPLVRLEAIYF